MKVIYGRPGDITWTLDGAGAAFVGTLNGDYLTNGRPRQVARLTWLSGAQTTASVLRLRATWASGALPPGGFCLQGLTLPPGQLITVAGKRAIDAGYTYALGGNSTTQRSVRRADGVVLHWVIPDDDLDDIEGVEFALWNDVYGDATIAADTVFDIGEALLGPAWTPPYGIEKGWVIEPIDPTTERVTESDQDYPDYKVLRRSFTCRTSVLTRAEAYGDGEFDGVTVDELWHQLAGQTTCGFIPRFRTPDGAALDTDWLHTVGMVGKCAKLYGITNAAGDYYAAGFDFKEYSCKV